MIEAPVSSQHRRGGRPQKASSILLLALPALTGLTLFPVEALALGENGTPITDSNYAIELHQGVETSGSRITGLGGAFVAMAADVDGMSMNPAGPAVREPYSVAHTDWGLGGGISFPSALRNTDYFNSGTTSGANEEMLFADGAAMLQTGPWAGGTSVELKQFHVANTQNELGDSRSLYVTFQILRLILAYNFGDWSVGAGYRIGSMRMQGSFESASQPPPQDSSTGYTAGVIWKPENQPYRLGLSMDTSRTSSIDSLANDDAPGGGGTVDVDLGQGATPYYLPAHITMPAEFRLGLAYQYGRPLNPPWEDPETVLAPLRRLLSWRERNRERELRALTESHFPSELKRTAALSAMEARHDLQRELDKAHLSREEARVREQLKRRYNNLGRSYLLICGSVIATLPSDSAVSTRSFLQQKVERVGESMTISPRLGVESEVVPQLLRLRVGTYIEPTRFSTNPEASRLHGTGGVDLRLLEWDLFGALGKHTAWRGGAMIDSTARYLGWGLSLGIWH